MAGGVEGHAAVEAARGEYPAGERSPASPTSRLT